MIEMTDLDMILNYLETTNLEPHDDYTSEFTYKDQKILFKYIKQLQQENQQLKDNWNELKKWLKDYLKLFNNPDYFEEQSIEDLNEVLSKMKELEKGKSE